MIQSADEYYALVSTIDQRRIDTLIANIPLNINRAGKHYQKLVKQIIYENSRPQPPIR